MTNNKVSNKMLKLLVPFVIVVFVVFAVGGGSVSVVVLAIFGSMEQSGHKPKRLNNSHRNYLKSQIYSNFWRT